MVVSYSLLALSFITLMSIVSFTGHHRLTVKEKPKSPAQPPRKWKACSTADASTIRCIKIMGSNIDPAQPSGKQHKLSSGTSSQVQFDGVMVPGPPTPAAMETRKSTCTIKANSKKDLCKLFECLRQEYGAVAKANEAVAKTCKDIAKAFN